MEITYIGHSGFLIEWDTCYFLFDYFKGNIPEMDSDKKIFVFASHRHEDHFNPEIFRLSEQYHNIEYVLSSDIRRFDQKISGMGLASVITDKIISVKPSNKYELYDKNNKKIILKTLKSTDCGVAFLLYYKGKTIYHAGDLNLWVWKEESKQFNHNMTANFNKIMEELKDLQVDLAFAPLDPRQEECYYMGLEYLLNTAKIKMVFPMHFWEKPSIIQQFKKERAVQIPDTEIMDIFEEGQKWVLDLPE